MVEDTEGEEKGKLRELVVQEMEKTDRKGKCCH